MVNGGDSDAATPRIGRRLSGLKTFFVGKKKDSTILGSLYQLCDSSLGPCQQARVFGKYERYRDLIGVYKAVANSSG